jgi:diguanylate cyclase (GGDEF)-like protein/PAS domain S-box-containing protein
MLRRDLPLRTALAAATATCVWTLLGIGPRWGELTLYTVTLLFIDLVGVLTIWRISVAARHDRPRHRVYMFLLISLTLYSVGDIDRLSWMWIKLVLDRGDGTGLGQEFYLAGSAAMVLGFLSYPIRVAGERAGIKFCLDAATVVIGAGVASWCLTISPAAAAAGGRGLGAAFIAATFGAVKVFATVKIVFNDHSPFTRASGIMGLVSLILSSLVVTLPVSWATDRWSAIYGLGPLCLLLAAERVLLFQLRADPHAMEPVRSRRRPFRILPYVAMAGMFAVLVILLRDGPDIRSYSALGGVIAISTLVVMRQLVAFADISDLLRRVGDQEQRVSSLLRNSSDITIIIDVGGTITYASSATTALLGRAPETVTGTHWLRHLHPADRHDALHATRALVASGHAGAPTTCQVRVRHADRTWRWLDVIVANHLADPHVNGFICNTRDTTETHQLHEELRHQARHDPLTALPNRRVFTQALAAALSRPTPTSVIIIDLDDFKPINDLHGHDTGDAALAHVARLLAVNTRVGDTAARLGGDEFAIVCPDTSAAQAVHLIQRIDASLTYPRSINGRTLTIAASIGAVTRLPSENTTADDLLRAADHEMYRVKAAHKSARRQSVR